MNAVCWVGKPYKNIYREECRGGESESQKALSWQKERESLTGEFSVNIG